jgi:CO/xanthine dehydrogenase Mo-binding subunit
MERTTLRPTRLGPTAAALANALLAAANVRIREMPLSPETVKSAIGDWR